tara:strand:- start:959 stop:1528 length:570 start_codon:yes stop_codon:yes gene_type:complete
MPKRKKDEEPEEEEEEEESKADPDPDAEVSDDDDDDEYEDKEDSAYVHVPQSWKNQDSDDEEEDEDEDEDEPDLDEGEEEGEEEDEEDEPLDDEVLAPDAQKFKLTKLTVSLVRKGKEGSLGFALSDVGSFITAVTKGGLAAKAGVQVGDKVTEVNGKDCGMASFATLLPKDKAQPIKLRLSRPVPVEE